MAKKEKPRAGRFVHIDFPTEGINSSADIMFQLSVIHLLTLKLHGNSQVKFSYSRKVEEEASKPNLIRLVK